MRGKQDGARGAENESASALASAALPTRRSVPFSRLCQQFLKSGFAVVGIFFKNFFAAGGHFFFYSLKLGKLLVVLGFSRECGLRFEPLFRDLQIANLQAVKIHLRNVAWMRHGISVNVVYWHKVPPSFQ